MLTLVGPDGASTVEGGVCTLDDGRVAAYLAPAALAAATGWELKPEGLCRGEVCVPVRTDLACAPGDGREGIDLAAVADALGAPYAIEAGAGVAAIGEPASLRAAQADDPAAPDFVLDTFAGEPFRFSSIGAKKKLLVTWASW